MLMESKNAKLKKNTKFSKIEETVSKRCTLVKRKDRTPKASDFKNVVRVVAQPKNHVQENIISVKNVKVGERPSMVQDSCDGHRQDVGRAGLKLRYVFKKEYGETPRYIRQKRYELKKCENVVVDEEPAVRAISDEEKDVIMKGLKNNLREVEKTLLSLPLIIDTISKQKYKKELENRCLRLQNDIDMLENHKVLVRQEKQQISSPSPAS